LPLVGKGKTYGLDVAALGDNWKSLELILKVMIYHLFEQ
jgi:hypothetical protein